MLPPWGEPSISYKLDLSMSMRHFTAGDIIN